MTLRQRAARQRQIERSGRRLSVSAGQARAFRDPNRIMVQTFSKWVTR